MSRELEYTVDLLSLKRDYESGLIGLDLRRRYGFSSNKTLYAYLHRAGVTMNRNLGTAKPSARKGVQLKRRTPAEQWLETTVFLTMRSERVFGVLRETIAPIAEQLGLEATATDEAIRRIVERVVPGVGEEAEEEPEELDALPG